MHFFIASYFFITSPSPSGARSQCTLHDSRRTLRVGEQDLDDGGPGTHAGGHDDALRAPHAHPHRGARLDARPDGESRIKEGGDKHTSGQCRGICAEEKLADARDTAHDQKVNDHEEPTKGNDHINKEEPTKVNNYFGK